MTVEELLARALTEEAEAREVDVAALHAEVLRRLPEGTAHEGRSRLVAVAAVALLAIGTVTGLVLLTDDTDDDGGGGARFTDSSRGEVATEFTCPQVVIDFRTSEDDGFLPDLTRGATPAQVARFEGAATYDFTTAGDSATLRLGNEDGSLGSITTYALVDGEWRMRQANVCTGFGASPIAPTTGALQLGEHGSKPWPAHELFRDTGLPAGFVDDRSHYNHAGIIASHRSMYVDPCPEEAWGWCWRSGEPTSQLIAPRLRSSVEIGRPHDISDLLVEPDMMVGRVNPFGIWAFDVIAPASFAAILQDGTRLPSIRVSQPEWGAHEMLVVMAVRDEVERLELRYDDGPTISWSPDEIPQE